MDNKPQVLIVGAGLAGLSCAWDLHKEGISFQILEASDSVGGRVKTDVVKGFLLDRGFQVLLTAYPEAQAIFDYPALALKKFYPGALVRVDERWHRLADPFRHPIDAVKDIFSPVGTLADKLRIARLRQRVISGKSDELFNRHETSTLTALHRDGFSNSFIQTFFRPFLGGVFLEPELNTSSRVFEFLFRMFSLGDTALPANGMRALPEQISSRLPADAITLNTPVTIVTKNSVSLGSGEILPADAVVIATDGNAAAKLLGKRPSRSQPVACLYFAADRPPFDDPLLVLNGNGDGPINNLCVPSLVSSSYAPAGATLISATVLQPERFASAQLESLVRAQLSVWFDYRVSKWEHLKTYWIDRALPQQPPGRLDHFGHLANGLYVCGDHTENSSINGALKSGRLVAEAVASHLSKPPVQSVRHSFGTTHRAESQGQGVFV